MNIRHLLTDLMIAVDWNNTCTDDELEESYFETVRLWEETKKIMNKYNKDDE
jgi:hypothetical protein